MPRRVAPAAVHAAVCICAECEDRRLEASKLRAALQRAALQRIAAGASTYTAAELGAIARRAIGGKAPADPAAHDMNVAARVIEGLHQYESLEPAVTADDMFVIACALRDERAAAGEDPARIEALEEYVKREGGLVLHNAASASVSLGASRYAGLGLLGGKRSLREALDVFRQESKG